MIGAAIGDCLTDQFTITSDGAAGTPVICGENGGYHSKFGFFLLIEYKVHVAK